MPDKPIINARGQIGWRSRVLSDLATAALWAGWVCLWIPVIGKFRQIVLHHRNLETAAIAVLDAVAPIPVVHSIIAVVGTGALLMLWALLPKRQVMQGHAATTIEDYARHFGLDPRAIQAGRASRICTVSHNEAGQVLEIAPAIAPAGGSMPVLPDPKPSG